MTAAELDVYQPRESAIPAKLAYARELANSGLLPASYRKNPANVLWAAEYGDMLGLSAMAAITGVHVIDGKPTASAGLISALVRRAGHKLRVTGNNKSATCVIIRSDDPAHPFKVTWTLRRDGDNPSAEEAGLLGKPVWKQYPASMLKSRAITQCARDACEEALFGLHYTAEELGADVDEDGVVIGEAAGNARPFTAEVVTENPPPAAERNGQSWYQQNVRLAKTFTDPDAGPKLYRAAAEAHKKGWISRGQQDEIQNLARTRTEKFRAATVVEVEDLAARAAAQHAQDAAEHTQEPPVGGDTAAEDTLPVEDPPDTAWPEVVKPGTGTPKGK